MVTDQKWADIQSLDLGSVKDKLRSRKGRVWCWLNKPDKVELEYRQFLYLVAANPGRTVVPWSQPLDDFWHEHILDTVKYRRDCERVFGHYLEHNPHLPKGSGTQRSAFADTKRMYREAFGPRARAGAAAASNSSSPSCGAGCSSTSFVPVFCAASAAASVAGQDSTPGGGDGARDASQGGKRRRLVVRRQQQRRRIGRLVLRQRLRRRLVHSQSALRAPARRGAEVAVAGGAVSPTHWRDR